MANLSHIQKDIDAERAQLDATIERLGERLTVGNLGREAKDHVAGGAEELIDSLMSRLGNGVQTRPLASALVGTGLSWLMSKPAEDTRQYRPRALYNGPKPAEGDPELETAAYVGTSQTRPDTPGAREAAQTKLAEIRAIARDMRARVAEGTEELSEEARARVVAAREKAIDLADGTAARAKRTARKSSDFVQDNPLIIGGVALALGAAVAGAAWWRNRDTESDTDAFDAADRIFEDEVARARVERNSSVFGLSEDEVAQDVSTTGATAGTDGSVLSELND